jgi:hypothetical protein
MCRSYTSTSLREGTQKKDRIQKAPREEISIEGNKCQSQRPHALYFLSFPAGRHMEWKRPSSLLTSCSLAFNKGKRLNLAADPYTLCVIAIYVHRTRNTGEKVNETSCGRFRPAHEISPASSREQEISPSNNWTTVNENLLHGFLNMRASSQETWLGWQPQYQILVLLSFMEGIAVINSGKDSK